jgi:hypothetical protein
VKTSYSGLETIVRYAVKYTSLNYIIVIGSIENTLRNELSIFVLTVSFELTKIIHDVVLCAETSLYRCRL